MYVAGDRSGLSLGLDLDNRAARVYYHGGNTVDGKITDDGFSFLKYAAAFLCDRNFGMFNDV